MIKKITIKNLIDFQRKNSDSTKSTFVNNLKKEKPKEEGGDYWITSLSAIGNCFKFSNPVLLDEKIVELDDKLLSTQAHIAKLQYQRNIDILEGIKDFDFDEIKPIYDLNFHKKPHDKSIVLTDGMPLQAIPSYVYSFSTVERDEIGGVWFVAKKDGYSKQELAMFSEMLFRYLRKNYGEDYYINSKQCVAVDVTKGLDVNYSDIENGNVTSIIDEALNDFKRFQ